MVFHASDEQLALLEFLRRNRDRTLVEWENATRKLSPAARLDLAAVHDHTPALFDRLIAAIEQGSHAALDAEPDEHTIARLEQGFSLEAIAAEYQVLRSALLRLLEAEPAPLGAGALLALNEAIDHAVFRAVTSYHESRRRTRDALERISRETFEPNGESRDVLRRYLKIVVDTIAAADTAVIYLREADRLVLRAAVGIEAPSEDRFSVPMGEGFAGLIASRRQPCFTASAHTDPLVRNPALVSAGVRALYGVPLVHGNELIGVAKMGSRTAAEFCDDDRQLFGDMAHRAAMLIVHRRVAEERDLFLAVLGHDLRSPLNTILMGARILQRGGKLSAIEIATAERIVAASQRMERMISDIADYTKVRFGVGIRLDRCAMDLGALLGQLVAELRALHPKFELRFEPRGELAGEWDSGRLAQVITNLVNNAVLYGDPSSPITIAADGANREEVVVKVHNFGEPIPHELVAHIFDAFKRGRTSPPGMGLGLYIVQHIAQAHGGLARVESSRERGTTFTVRLPRNAPSGDANA